nr:hypothetical protein [Tanacetum cinerariifolium]
MFIIKFLKKIQVRLNVPVRRIRTDNGTEFVNQTLRDYYEEVGISHETSVACSPQQNGVVERRNRTLIKAARTMLIYAQALLFLWAETVATACFTQNRSIVCLRHGKTPYELMHGKQPDLSFFHVFGALKCLRSEDEAPDFIIKLTSLMKHQLHALHDRTRLWLPLVIPKIDPSYDFVTERHHMIRRTRRIVETIHVDFDELTAIASEQSSSRPALNEMTTATISLGLVQKPSSSIPYVPPSRNNWICLQAKSTSSPCSTIVDKDAPSPSKSQTILETQSSVIPQDVEEDIHDIKVTHMENDLLFGVPIPEFTSDKSSSTVSSHTI